MAGLIAELVMDSAARTPDAPALADGSRSLTYRELAEAVTTAAGGLLDMGLGARERVAVYLPKQVETVVALFGASAAGGVFVPVNPALKARQVAHILTDCNVRVLVTSADRLASLAEVLADCHDLRQVVLVGDGGEDHAVEHIETVTWSQLMAPGQGAGHRAHRTIDGDVAAILYTSGSTGKPKGVVLSHRNMVTGAISVSSYLGNTPGDRLLAVLPFSFDYGFSQLTTAFRVGAFVRLMNYLLPRDIPRAVAKHAITGLACVPPLWMQLAALDWPDEALTTLRYITSTGGRMPQPLVDKLRALMPEADVYLMYGLTEAFRSTYLPPDKIDERPNSIGKAIPNAEILVVRPDGGLCVANEPGELVHRGALVSLGYWNDPKRTAERFKPAPGQDPALPIPEMAVWSGDTVRMDEDGYLYFVGRRDEMIKTSGYRVSPTEVEEVVYASGAVAEAVALGVADAALGEAIVVVATPRDGGQVDVDTLLGHCMRELPRYMVPAKVIVRADLPRNPNGKIDRKSVAATLDETG